MKLSKNSDTKYYSISEAAQKAGISVHTLRMYEREGLLIPVKEGNSNRKYTDCDIERIDCIRKTINQDKISIEGIKRILSLAPCWQLKNCSSSERENCPAFTEHSKPCWAYKHKNNLCETNECRNCIVYQTYSNCNSIKHLIRTVSVHNSLIQNNQ